MRLLIINPNTSVGVTERIREAANAVARPGDVFATTCPPDGPELIVTPDDAEEAERAVIDYVRGDALAYDGIVLASFGNTGAGAVRELRKSIPVVGIAQAAFAAVRNHGGPFGIVTFGAQLVPGLQAETEAEGLTDALLGVSYLEGEDFGDPATVQHRYHKELAALCVQTHQKGAQSIVMGGGPLAGFAPRLSAQLPIPVIDGTQAAIAQIRHMLGVQSGEMADRSMRAKT